jgi:hypothetical protein
MNLGLIEIDCGKVSAVLLSSGWHDVFGLSFRIANYLYCHYLEGGEMEEAWAGYDKEGTGFSFTEQGSKAPICGPISSIIAVRLVP